MCLITDEVAQVTVLHVGQDHEWRTLWRQTDSQQRENIWVTEVLHDDPLLQELGHLLQICDACPEKRNSFSSSNWLSSCVEKMNVQYSHTALNLWQVSNSKLIFRWLGVSYPWKTVPCTNIISLFRENEDGRSQQLLQYHHPHLTHTKVPFPNCIPASHILHFGPAVSAVIWLQMEALYVLRDQPLSLQLRLDPEDRKRWHLVDVKVKGGKLRYRFQCRTKISCLHPAWVTWG